MATEVATRQLAPGVRHWLAAMAERQGQERRGIVRWQLIKVPPLSDSERAAAIAALEESNRSLPPSEIMSLLTRLAEMTVGRPGDSAATELRFKVYARELANWPGAVVRHVLTSQPKIEKFWPAWSELAERLALHAGPLRRDLDMLRNGAGQARTVPLDAAERARVAGKMRQLKDALRAGFDDDGAESARAGETSAGVES